MRKYIAHVRPAGADRRRGWSPDLRTSRISRRPHSWCGLRSLNRSESLFLHLCNRNDEQNAEWSAVVPPKTPTS